VTYTTTSPPPQTTMSIPTGTVFKWHSNNDAYQGNGFEFCLKDDPSDAAKQSEIAAAKAAWVAALATPASNYQVYDDGDQDDADQRCGANPKVGQPSSICIHQLLWGICADYGYYATCRDDQGKKINDDAALQAYASVMNKQATPIEIANFDIEQHQQRSQQSVYTKFTEGSSNDVSCSPDQQIGQTVQYCTYVSCCRFFSSLCSVTCRTTSHHKRTHTRLFCLILFM